MKNTIKTAIALCLSITMAAVCFAGCSPKEGAQSNSSKNNDTVSTSSQEEQKLDLIGHEYKYDPNLPINDGKDITLKFWYQQGFEEMYEKYAKEYSKIHPNVKFDFTVNSYADYFNKLPIALSSGTGPDIFHHNASFNSVLAPYLQELPPDKFPDDKLKTDFNFIDETKLGGKQYYIRTGSKTGGLFYNKKLWADAGLTENDIPKTWDELRTVAKKLTKTEGNKITVSGLNFNAAFESMFNAMAYQKGYTGFDPTGTKAYITSEAHIKGAQFLYDLYNVDKVGSIKLQPGTDSFLNEQSAICYSWGWFIGVIDSNKPDLEYGWFPVPTEDGKQAIICDGNGGEATACVSNKTTPDKQAAAFDFLSYFFANDDAVYSITNGFGEIPAKKVNIERITDPIMQDVAKIIDRTIMITGDIPAEFTTNMQKYVSDAIMINGIPIDKALTEAEQIINTNCAGKINVGNSIKLYKFADELVK